MLHWDQIRYFVAVAREGSVSRAAAALGVSHATVLRQVGRLEQRLGTRLFDHRQTGYRITAEGQDLLRLGLEMEANAEALLRRALGGDSTLAGDLHLLLPEPSMLDLLPMLGAFTDQHPQIRLHADSDTAVSPPTVDVALRVTDAPPEGLVGRQLRRLSFRFRGQQACIDAKHRRWILWQDPADAEAGWAWQQRALATVTRTPTVVLTVSGHAQALAAARAGIGIALLTGAAAADLPALAEAGNLPPRSLWLLTHPDLRRSARVRAFMDFAARAAAKAIAPAERPD